MRRDIFTEEHEMFRAQVRRFVETEIEPKIDGWNRAGMSDRESWRKLGAEQRASVAEALWRAERSGESAVVDRLRAVIPWARPDAR